MQRSMLYGIKHHMKASPYYRQKDFLEDGSIIEMMIWVVPAPVKGSPHSFKYRLYFGRDGERIVGYDNERGKGDHKHIREQEMPYAFTTPEQLIADFIADIRRYGEIDK